MLRQPDPPFPRLSDYLVQSRTNARPVSRQAGVKDVAVGKVGARRACNSRTQTLFQATAWGSKLKAGIRKRGSSQLSVFSYSEIAISRQTVRSVGTCLPRAILLHWGVRR